MPRKIRQLEADLLRAGFLVEPGRGKGSHRQFYHPDTPGIIVILAGQRGADAKQYQERDVREAIAEVRSRRDTSESDRA